MAKTDEGKSLEELSDELAQKCFGRFKFLMEHDNGKYKDYAKGSEYSAWFEMQVGKQALEKYNTLVEMYTENR